MGSYRDVGLTRFAIVASWKGAMEDVWGWVLPGGPKSGGSMSNANEVFTRSD